MKFKIWSSRKFRKFIATLNRYLSKVSGGMRKYETIRRITRKSFRQRIKEFHWEIHIFMSSQFFSFRRGNITWIASRHGPRIPSTTPASCNFSLALIKYKYLDLVIHKATKHILNDSCVHFYLYFVSQGRPIKFEGPQFWVKWPFLSNATIHSTQRFLICD